jgi:hypothetical protein
MNGKAAIVALGFACTLTAALAGCSGGGPATTPGGGTKGNKASSADVIRFPPGGAANVTAWYHGRGGTEFTSLTKTLDHVSRVRAAGGVTAFAGTCGQIKSAALAARAAPPIPLASVAKVYSAALAGYVKSATDCERASAAHDPAALRVAAKEVDADSILLNHAAAVLIAALSESPR